MATARGTKKSTAPKAPDQKRRRKTTKLNDAAEPAGDDTAAKIEEARRSGLSWKAVGETLGIGSPSATRKAYTELTGRHHNDIEGVAQVQRQPRAPRGSGGTTADDAGKPAVAPVRKHRPKLDPEWNAESDQDAIIEALSPVLGPGGVVKSMTRIKVRRMGYKTDHVVEEDHKIRKLIGLTWNKDETELVVEFHDDYNHAYRAIRVQDIKEVIR